MPAKRWARGDDAVGTSKIAEIEMRWHGSFVPEINQSRTDIAYLLAIAKAARELIRDWNGWEPVQEVSEDIKELKEALYA